MRLNCREHEYTINPFIVVLDLQGHAVGRGEDVSVGDERAAAEKLPSVHERGHEGVLVLPGHPPVQDLGHEVGARRQPVPAAQRVGVVGGGVVAVHVVVLVAEVALEGKVLVPGQGVQAEVVVDVVHGLVLKVKVDVVGGPLARAPGLRLVVRAAHAVDLKKGQLYLLTDGWASLKKSSRSFGLSAASCRC